MIVKIVIGVTFSREKLQKIMFVCEAQFEIFILSNLLMKILAINIKLFGVL